MDWILVYSCDSYKVYKDKEGKRIKYVYKDGKEVIKPYDWSNDDICQ